MELNVGERGVKRGKQKVDPLRRRDSAAESEKAEMGKGLPDHGPRTMGQQDKTTDDRPWGHSTRGLVVVVARLIGLSWFPIGSALAPGVLRDQSGSPGEETLALGRTCARHRFAASFSTPQPRVALRIIGATSSKKPEAGQGNKLTFGEGEPQMGTDGHGFCGAS